MAKASPGMKLEMATEAGFRLVQEWYDRKYSLKYCLREVEDDLLEKLSEVRTFFKLEENARTCKLLRRDLLRGTVYTDALRKAFLMLKNGEPSWRIRTILRAAVSSIMVAKRTVDVANRENISVRLVNMPRNWLPAPPKNDRALRTPEEEIFLKFYNRMKEGEGFAIPLDDRNKDNCSLDLTINLLIVLAQEVPEFFDEITHHIRISKVEYMKSIKLLVEAIKRKPNFVTERGEKARICVKYRLERYIQDFAKNHNCSNIHSWLEVFFGLLTLFNYISICPRPQCGLRTNRQKQPNLRFADFVALRGLQDRWGLRSVDMFTCSSEGCGEQIEQHRVEFTLCRSGILVNFRDVKNKKRSRILGQLMTFYSLDRDITIGNVDMELKMLLCGEYNKPEENVPCHALAFACEKEEELDEVLAKEAGRAEAADREDQAEDGEASVDDEGEEPEQILPHQQQEGQAAIQDLEDANFNPTRMVCLRVCDGDKLQMKVLEPQPRRYPVCIDYAVYVAKKAALKRPSRVQPERSAKRQSLNH